MAHCRVLLCNINKKSGCQDGGFLSISNKDLVTFHFSLAIYPFTSSSYQKKTAASQILFMKQQSLFCRQFYFSTGKETVTWNKSPSRRISNFPPIRSVRLLAI